MADNMRLRTVKVPDDLWNSAMRIATSRGESLSHLLRECLRAYVERNGNGTVREEAAGTGTDQG